MPTSTDRTTVIPTRVTIVPADPVSAAGAPRPPSTAPAVTPPTWSGRKTAVVAALAIGFASVGAVGAAAAMPDQTASTGRTGPGGFPRPVVPRWPERRSGWAAPRGSERSGQPRASDGATTVASPARKAPSPASCPGGRRTPGSQGLQDGQGSRQPAARVGRAVCRGRRHDGSRRGRCTCAGGGRPGHRAVALPAAGARGDRSRTSGFCRSAVGRCARPPRSGRWRGRAAAVSRRPARGPRRRSPAPRPPSRPSPAPPRCPPAGVPSEAAPGHR